MPTLASALAVKRLKWMDIGKGAAMLLVLVGHILSPDAPATKNLHDAIYNFHMGWFLFLAGCSASISYTRSRRGGGLPIFVEKGTHPLYPLCGVVFSYALSIRAPVAGFLSSRFSPYRFHSQLQRLVHPLPSVFARLVLRS